MISYLRIILNILLWSEDNTNANSTALMLIQDANPILWYINATNYTGSEDGRQIEQYATL